MALSRLSYRALTVIFCRRLDLENAEVTTREKLALSERGVNLVSLLLHTDATEPHALTRVLLDTQLSRHLNRLQAQLELLTSSVPPLPTLPSFAPNLNTPTPNAMYGAQAVYTAAPGGAGAYNPYMASYGGQPGTPGIRGFSPSSYASLVSPAE